MSNKSKIGLCHVMIGVLLYAIAFIVIPITSIIFPVMMAVSSAFTVSGFAAIFIYRR